jgi:hypothetical protein
VNRPWAFGRIQVLLVAIALTGAACAHKQLVAGRPALGAHPEFTGESEQPAPEIPAAPAHVAARLQAGNSRPAFIGELKPRGLDVALVIPRSGGSFATLHDMKAKMMGLTESIHRLVPIARVGIVLYDPRPEGIATVPLTNSLSASLESIAAIKDHRSTSENANVRGAAVAAVSGMNWNPNAKRVIVLVVDKAIETNEAAGLVEIARKFRADGGVVNAVDALPQSALESDNTTREALRAIAAAGGGSVKPLVKQQPAAEHPPGPVSDRASIA